MKEAIRYLIKCFKRIFRYCDHKHCYNKMKHHLVQINEDGTETNIYYCDECSEYLLRAKKAYYTTPTMKSIYNKTCKDEITYDEFKVKFNVNDSYVPIVYYIEEI